MSIWLKHQRRSISQGAVERKLGKCMRANYAGVLTAREQLMWKRCVALVWAHVRLQRTKKMARETLCEG